MEYLVFAQTPEPTVPVASLLQNARRYFGMSVNVLEATGLGFDGSRTDGSRVLVELENPKRGYTARFELEARLKSDADLALAREAEARSRAAGMANLAERCPCVWAIVPAPNTGEVAKAEFCAAVASTALGPVMPRDAASLFGVRGALERAEQAARRV